LPDTLAPGLGTGSQAVRAPASVAAPAGLLGVLLALALTPAARSPLVVLAAAVTALLAAWLVRRLVHRPALALVGAGIAGVAAWLIPQRPDPGSAIVLTALFGAGAGLAAVAAAPGGAAAGRTLAATAGVVGAVLAGLRLAGARTALLVVAVGLVVTAGIVARVAADADADRSPRGRVVGIGTVLVLIAATVTAFFGSSTVDASWFGGGVVHGSRATNQVALTFDDGPNTYATPAIMRILDHAGVRGTFFVVGKALVKEPGVVRDLVDHGHLVGNHSYHHDQWRWLDPRYPELARTQHAFADDVGVCPAWYRPPHGQRTPFLARVVHDDGMRMALWDVSAGDWATRDPRVIAGRVLGGVRGGSIVDLHDGLDGNPAADRSALVQALPLILAGLRAKGLAPVRLDKLVGGPGYIRCPGATSRAAETGWSPR